MLDPALPARGGAQAGCGAHASRRGDPSQAWLQIGPGLACLLRPGCLRWLELLLRGAQLFGPVQQMLACRAGCV